VKDAKIVKEIAVLKRLFLQAVATAVVATAVTAANLSVAQTVEGSVSQVDIAPAWAANSVNAVVFRKNSIVSSGGFQYAAFYDAQRRVVLAKRKSGAAQWEVRQTPYTGNARDAHNAISIMVDGAGVLHVAWDHHNNRLHYARSIAPGSLELSAETPMIGRGEEHVTYPEFHRLQNGDLLFLYRDGASGNGNLVMNRFDVATGKWQRLHDNLIDGEGKRNAYWQAFVDHRGTIHLSWVWRESPDVASNHDLCYARSRDGGLTWETSAGEKYALPINAGTAEYAAHVAQGHELINQTSMSADANGDPYIATYWRDSASDVPQYHVVFKHKNGWKTASLDFRKTPFSLSGTGTKEIPISRPQIVIDHRTLPAGGWLVFRDQERGSKVSVASIQDFTAAKWTIADLTSYPVDDWEPSYDTELWKTQGVLDLYVQRVRQVDGEKVGAMPPQMARIVEWKPMPSASPSLAQPLSARSSFDMSHADIAALIGKVNGYWQTRHSPADSAFWDIAAYHTGNMEAYKITGDPAYLDYSLRWAEHNRWMGATGQDKSKWKSTYGESDEYVLFGDWQACFQTYIDLYRIERDDIRIARAKEVMDFEMSTPRSDYWWWADSLYMVMPVMTKLYQATGDRRYLDKLHEYFSYASHLMYDAEAGLFFRDDRYIYPKHKSLNGKKDFWARGDGWVFAALAKVLDVLPADDPHRGEYLAIFRRMAAALRETQQPEGHWTRSILDPAQAPGFETSGTAFFTYGMLWGINHGVLDRDEYLPVARKSWRYLVDIAIQPDGRVGYVQPIGDRADPGQIVDRNSTTPFGVGAVLLALAEMQRFQKQD
jgi:rhamnogalacturonyl hydrolase YesR